MKKQKKRDRKIYWKKSDHSDLDPACWRCLKCSGMWSWIDFYKPWQGGHRICPRFEFHTTNNGTGYEALIASLNIAKEVRIIQIKILSYFQLVVAQVRGEHEVKEPAMIKYFQKIKELSSNFEVLEIQQFPRLENIRANMLPHLATSNYSNLSNGVFVDYLRTSSLSRTLIELDWSTS